jgi:hypothetical protein
LLNALSILAFLATIFFSAANLTPDDPNDTATKLSENTVKKTLGLAMGFGAANAIFSIPAYFTVEPLPIDISLSSAFGYTPPTDSKIEKAKKRKERLDKFRKLLYGRRRLLLQSLASGTVMLFILSQLLRLSPGTSKLGAVTVFVFLFTACKSSKRLGHGFGQQLTVL